LITEEQENLRRQHFLAAIETDSITIFAAMMATSLCSICLYLLCVAGRGFVFMHMLAKRRWAGGADSKGSKEHDLLYLLLFRGLRHIKC
jgi:hypothetical protein